jgi:hypothetical protein
MPERLRIRVNMGFSAPSNLHTTTLMLNLGNKKEKKKNEEKKKREKEKNHQKLTNLSLKPLNSTDGVSSGNSANDLSEPSSTTKKSQNRGLCLR